MSEPTPDLPPELPGAFRTCFLAMRAASQAQRMPDLQTRRADLQQLLRLLVENRAALSAAVTADFGCRSEFETHLTELLQCQEAIRYARARIERWMKPQRRRLDPLTYPLARAWTFPQPLGVIGIVVPWNFPIALAFQPLIYAFAAGNRAMVKLSEHSPNLAALLQQLTPRYFPPDKLAFFADQPGHGPLFTRLPFDHLFFTGSPETGKAVMAQCAANLTPVTLELGGKSPCVVAEDFDLETAAERILWAKLLNAGQICTSVDYLLLPRTRIEDFVRLAQGIAARRYPDLGNGDYTTVIDARQHARLLALIEDARSKGARIVPLCPGQSGDPTRRLLPPQLLLDVRPDMQVLQQEIFGPLLPVLGYDSHQQALDFINARPPPLALYLYSHDRALQRRYLHQTLSGGVGINECLVQSSLHDLPFGGIGRSGMGHYHGREGFLTFSKLRPVFRQSRWRPLALLMPPYRERARRLLAFLLRLSSRGVRS